MKLKIKIFNFTNQNKRNKIKAAFSFNFRLFLLFDLKAFQYEKILFDCAFILQMKTRKILFKKILFHYTKGVCGLMEVLYITCTVLNVMNRTKHKSCLGNYPVGIQRKFLHIQAIFN